MDSLITSEEARRQLRLTTFDIQDTDVAANVADKSVEATGAIIDYIKRPDHGWTPDTVPSVIRSAILLALVTLYECPGEDPITDAVMAVLRRQRDPAYA